MTEFDLFDSIGNVDDELIEKAKQNKSPKRKLIITIGSLAACIAITCTSIVVSQNINNNSGMINTNSDVNKSGSDDSETDLSEEEWAGGASSETTHDESSKTAGTSDTGTDTSQTAESEEQHSAGACSEATPDESLTEIGTSDTNKDVSHIDTSEGQQSFGASSEVIVLENSDEVALEEMSFEIYYVVNDKIEKKTVVTCASSEKIFEIWKIENHIGDEVKLVSVNVSQVNSETSEYEYSGVGVAEHRSDGKTIYTLRVTKNIENYYDDINSELLLETLRKTMTGMSETPPDDYDLVLEEEYEQFFEDDEILPDEAESNHIDPNDIWYNEQGEILE